MAVNVYKAVTIANRDALPVVINDARLERAVTRAAHGAVTAVTGDSIGSTYILASIPSTAMVRAVKLSNAALTGGAANIGVSQPTSKGSAAISAALFAAAESVATAQSHVDVTNQSGTYTPLLEEMPVWQAAGLAADPGYALDIVVTLTAALTAGGVLGLEVSYVDNGG
jgi:hypothetical protein